VDILFSPVSSFRMTDQTISLFSIVRDTSQ
jgi:hypothetical protein